MAEQITLDFAPIIMNSPLSRFEQKTLDTLATPCHVHFVINRQAGLTTMFKGKLIASGQNAKTVKGDGTKYETAIMYLAPFNLSSRNICPMAEQAKCHVGCLNSAGRGAFNNVQKARLRKAEMYHADREAFMNTLANDIERFVAYCKKREIKPVVRLNGTSDIQFEVAHPCDRQGFRYASIFEAFPEVQFYDYTKIYKRAYRELPANYHLTLSYSAASERYADAVMKAHEETGVNLAIVYRDKNTADYRRIALGDSVTFVDGDADDLRFLDPGSAIVALLAKGKAKQDQSGFVID